MEELVEYLDRGLQFKRKPETMDEMKEVGNALMYFTSNLPWAYADWVNVGTNLFGESFSQLLPDVGRAEKTLRNWIFVGSRIPFDERRFKLEFSFYSEVARLLREAREALLARAEVEEWTITRLRQEIKGGDKKPRKPKIVECPACHVTFEIKPKEEIES